MNFDMPSSKGPSEAVEHITVIKVPAGSTATTQASPHDAEVQRLGGSRAEEQAHLAEAYRE